MEIVLTLLNFLILIPNIFFLLGLGVLLILMYILVPTFRMFFSPSPTRSSTILFVFTHCIISFIFFMKMTSGWISLLLIPLGLVLYVFLISVSIFKISNVKFFQKISVGGTSPITWYVLVFIIQLIFFSSTPGDCGDFSGKTIGILNMLHVGCRKELFDLDLVNMVLKPFSIDLIAWIVFGISGLFLIYTFLKFVESASKKITS